MSETFNPLAEAQSNASVDRRRFYDWVGDSADHQDNEAFRVANQDMANYLSSRDYQDDSGSLHSAENGQFVKSPNTQTEDEYYSRLQADTETEGAFAGRTLKQIAETVREARRSNDKTLENDARAAFDNMFMTMAEKYSWQGTVENADGTTTDRNLIADQKLAYYESIMDQEADKVDRDSERASSSEFGNSEDNSASNNERSQHEDESTDAESDEAEAGQEEARKPQQRAEHQDEDTLAFADLTDDAGVKEGESLEEYEARQPREHSKSADDLEMVSIEEDSHVVTADDLELLPIEDDDTEDEAPKKTSRLRRFGTPLGLAAEASAWVATRERGRRRNRIIALIGGAALATTTAALLVKGHDVRGGGLGSIFGDLADKVKDAVDSAPDASTGGNNTPEVTSKAHELFGNGIIDVRSGDGYTQVLDRLLDAKDIHLSSSELYDLHQQLEQVRGEYIDLNGVNDSYTMNNGDAGLSRPDSAARMNEATQKTIVRWLETHGKL